MKRLHIALVALMLLLLSGCGQTVVETLQVPQEPGPNAAGLGKTIVILPFADYTYADSLSAAYRREMAITESLTDRLVTNGFNLPIQEDVFDYLIDQAIISLVTYDQNSSLSLKNELEGEWSDVMKDQIRVYIAEQQTQHDNQIASSPGTHGLTAQTIAKIGRKFHADYIVRGRILEFKTRQEENRWAPWKKGILPFLFGTTDQLSVGFARTDQYDYWDDMRADTFGFLYPDDNEQEYSSGQVDQAVIQLRIWVQEAATGNIVWTNRIDVKSSPRSMWADNQRDTLFNRSIETASTAIIDNFITSYFHVAPVKFIPPATNNKIDNNSVTDVDGNL